MYIMEVMKATTKTVTSGKKQTNPNSLANIEKHKFKKGQSGNPAGSPKGVRISTLIKRQLAKMTVDPESKEEMTQFEMIILAHARQAMKGDGKSTDIIFDRLEGKPKSGLLGGLDEDEENAISKINITVDYGKRPEAKE